MEITRVREICYKTARDHGFNLYCTVEVNSRLKRTLGRVRWDEEGELKVIEFSKTFLETETDYVVTQTILHELAHAFVFLETGEIHGHDAMFRAMCHRLGTLNDGMYAKVLSDNMDRHEAYKYTLYCSKCGKPVGHRSRACDVTKYPEHYYSKCCDAPLDVELNW